MRRFTIRSQDSARRRRLAALGIAVLTIVLWRMHAAPEGSPLGLAARARKAVREVQDLERQAAQLEVIGVALEEQARERVRLKRLLAERDRLEAAGLRAVPARVTRDVSRGLEHEVIINRGRRHRVREHDVLTSASGLVGVVVEANQHTSRAILLTDRRAGVPVRVDPTAAPGTEGDSGETHNGIVSGGRDDGLLWLGYLAPDANIASGDEVCTSGDGTIYPEAIPVGLVHGSVILDPAPPRAAVAPAVKWGQLREVLVVHRTSR